MHPTVSWNIAHITFTAKSTALAFCCFGDITQSHSDWSHCFTAKTVAQVHVTSYNMQQYINALSIIPSTTICAALPLSGSKHEKQSTTNFLVSKNQHFLLANSVQFQVVLQFPNHHCSVLHFLLVVFLTVSSLYSAARQIGYVPVAILKNVSPNTTPCQHARTRARTHAHTLSLSLSQTKSDNNICSWFSLI